MVEVCHCKKKRKIVKRHKQKRILSKSKGDKSVIPPQPSPVVTQYVYRDNLALNILNDKLKDINEKLSKTEGGIVAKTEGGIAKTTTTETQTDKVKNKSRKTQTLKTVIPSPAELLASQRIHKSSSIPTSSDINKRNYETFENALINETQSLRALGDTVGLIKDDVKDNNDYEGDNEIPQIAIRLNKKGLPDRRTKEGKEYYKQQELLKANDDEDNNPKIDLNETGDY